MTTLEKANQFIVSQFGDDPKWTELTTALIEKLLVRPITLTDIDNISGWEDGGKKAFAVLALLSCSMINLVEMNYVRGDEIVDPAEVSKRLRAWHKLGGDEAEWHSWASQVIIRWQLKEPSA